MQVALSASRTYCRSLTRRTARNFYYAFWTLPTAPFQAMCALYAFMRLTDDLGDDHARPIEERRLALRDWREQLSAALDGQDCRHPVFPALAATFRQYEIPAEYLQALVSGVEMDLEPVCYPTFEALAHYCYHVAGAVGLCCLKVWGVRDFPAAVPAGIACGQAFQLTNILRDLQEDAQAGRVYLPSEDLERFGYTFDDLQAGRLTPAFQNLMAFETARNHALYEQALPLFDGISDTGRPILQTMLGLYRGLLQEIERRRFDVYTRRVKLSRWHKLSLAARGLWQRHWLAWTGQGVGSRSRSPEAGSR